ncbi:glycosyltransferase [Arthrobacter sp. StoSoilB20]|uniref:glycosyltransferase family protein n=1 Tax=Arthrobacter sp. StoSoilB20 TaxID=2830995 RepID=UPI001CC5E9AF|nr:glycosyltransferase [Arthrobacter sp. StoSoilB20]BCW59943.1 glycosyl transferase [Arthrobacter sp. StoSoilB20]
MWKEQVINTLLKRIRSLGAHPSKEGSGSEPANGSLALASPDPEGEFSNGKIVATIDFPEAVALPAPINTQKLRVATILSPLSEQLWTYEWDCIAIQPQTWRKTLDSSTVSLFFVESSWLQSNEAWANFPGSPTARRQLLSDIVEWCKARNIETVYWSRDSLPNRVELSHAVDTFDKILMTDGALLEEYRARFGQERFQAMGYAAQPKLHNPVRRRNEHQNRGIGVVERTVSLAPGGQHGYIVAGASDAAAREATGLETLSELDPLSRPQGGEATQAQARLPYEKLLTAYKAYKCLLSSDPREIVEATASGAPVVTPAGSAHLVAVEELQITEAHDRSDAANVTRALIRSQELRDRTVHLSQRKIWQHHTYAHRAAQILEYAGIHSQPIDVRSMSDVPKISAVVSTIRPERISDILKTIGRQTRVEVELIVLAHGFEPDERRLRSEAADFGLDNLVVLQQSRSTPLGACLNLAVSASSGTYIAKIDDDDLYGLNYLQDQAAAHRYSGAAVTGKRAHYMHLEESNATLLRFAEFEHRFTDFIMGPTIFTTRETLTEIPFKELNRGEDSEFLKTVVSSGGSIYSSDRFNFVQMRSGAGANHTWSASERDLMATGLVTAFGLNEQHVMF